ncbi:DUF3883 domain-containing protein [Chloroflexota bacterium]
MDLENEVKRLFAETATTHVNILPSIAKAEEFLKESYEGRYFFELIQNARDANKALNKDGVILIQLEEDRLNISNTGAPFSSPGVESICRIGKSDKASQDFIGHKGYGFKSVQEITEKPLISTEFGTLYFDKQKTLNESYPNSLIEPDAVPLFFFPHFSEEKLDRSRFDDETDIVTQIVLPFRTGISKNEVFSDFSIIGGKQLALLGNISRIVFSSDMGDVIYQKDSRPTTHLVEVSRNGEFTFFKEFQPRRKIIIPDNVYLKLEKREKQLFEKDRGIEIKLLLEWDRKQKKLVHSDGTKLYLFYPLEITSGFRFLIHSYFSVNPERKELRKTALNEFILHQIAEFIGGHFLEALKKSNKASLLEILFFKRIPDSGLDKFYDDVVSLLKERRFIYDNVTKRFYTPAEVMVADGLDRELFPHGEFAGKRLIFIESREIQDWLVNELKIPYLDSEFIREHIELECVRQRKKKNTKFFQILYNYVSDHDLNLQGKRILLTEHYGLVNNEIDVFYRSVRRDISLPKSLRKKITFIHKDITISGFRDSKSKTGITEFSMQALVSKLLKLLDDPEVDRADIIRTLKALDIDRKDIDRRSLSEIKSKVLVPVKGKTEWLSPLYNPIYFDTEDIRALFPHGHFLDLNKLVGSGADDFEWKKFLKILNIWDKPALYLRTHNLNEKDPRNDDFVRYTGKYSKPFTIINDRCLDIPVKFNKFFFDKVISHWDEYVVYIEDYDLPALGCRSYYSTNSDRIDGTSRLTLTQFVNRLKTENWMWVADDRDPVSRDNVVAIDLFDYEKPHLQVLKRYLSIVPIDHSSKQNLIDTLQISHFNKPTASNYIRIFELLHKQYPEPPQTKDFLDCFNRILTFLFEFYFYSRTSQVDVIDKLRGSIFLAVNDLDNVYSWEPSEKILYIDNKLLYDQFPRDIKTRLQPVFTNRDKNTFGRIASQIGRVLSKSVTKNIMDPITTKSVSIVKDIAGLPDLIALLESLIQRPFNDSEITSIKNTYLIERDDLKTRLSIKGTSEFEVLINEDYAIEHEEDYYYLNVRSSAWGNVKTKAHALTRLLEEILDLDLKIFTPFLDTTLREPPDIRRQKILSDYDLTLERINEIRSLLEEQALSNIQQFWVAILHCKNITSQTEFLVGTTLDFRMLSSTIMIPESELQMINERIDFDNLSNPRNIPDVELLFHRLDITLKDFNLASYIRITFKNYHNQELEKLRNKLERKFKSFLYHYLIRSDEQQQSQFLDLMERYQCIEPEIDENTIRLDYEQCFNDNLKTEFSSFPILLTTLKKEARPVDIAKIFYSNKRRLISALKKAQLPMDYVEDYLKNNEIRSKLYFAFRKKLVTDYRAKFRKLIDDKASKEGKPSSKVNLEDYRDLEHKGIENYQSKAVDIPQPTGSRSGGGGWGWTPPDKSREDLIGKVAEWNILQVLIKTYPTAKWVSRYAYIEGYDPEGRDGLGYDIEYVDDKGRKIYVEVKARDGDEKSFKISINEIRKAQEVKENYHIIFVSNALNSSLRRYRNLGNIFIYDDGEDFTKNKRFRAINEDYKIIFE